jgi:hypothetical protein
MMTPVFWDIMPYSGDTSCLHYAGSFLACSLVLKMDVICSPEQKLTFTSLLSIISKKIGLSNKFFVTRGQQKMKFH